MISRKTRHHLVVYLLLSGLIACQKDQVPAPASTIAQTYIDQLVNYMQANSINRKAIDWTDFKQQVDQKAHGAQTITDLYPAIQLALTLLGDHHSFYIPAQGNPIYGTSPLNCSDSSPAQVILSPLIGYVKITAFSGTGSAANDFAQAIQEAIKKADSDSIRGWIVDLRNNTGGNMWPMLAGIGPILGEGSVGYFIDPTGNNSSWSYQQGAALLDQTRMALVSGPYRLRKPNPKVAVLTNRSTASSGEAIAISFKGRSQTRSFGTPTCGLSTANGSITLSDGASLYVTQATMADRTRTLYGKPVEPDESAYSSTAVDKAVAWLLQ
ncbi:S41 family peptidase [Spirosoma spitsbergense]|uniref:S41 family peptidase n=1 Tax=Spirosoma spitsbergense TaxID=431554 RepID=UPI000367BB09|nr:S41 family peptidase [Spirosoma spitsbergense]